MLPSDCICYLINLDRSPDRLTTMSARLSALEITFERIPGVDGMQLDEARFREETRENRYYKPLRRGEVGCQLGHLNALRSFMASGARYLLLLEDDASFESGFMLALQAAIALRRDTHDPVLQWDVLKLSRRRRRHIDLSPLGEHHSLVEYGLSVPITTAAAVWTRESAERWIAAYHGTRRPIDCDLQHPWEYGLVIRSIHPPVVVAEDIPSSMGSAKLVARNPLPKLHYEARRAWPKLKSFGMTYGWGFIIGWLWRRRLEYRSPRPELAR